MAWSRGTSLFSRLVEVISANVTEDDARKTIYEEMIEAFEDLDCDDLETLFEATDDSVLDEALIAAYPDVIQGEFDI